MTTARALALLEEARSRGITPTIVEATGATIIVVADVTPRTDDLLSLEEARLLVKLKTTRPILDAIRAGDLEAYGKQRSRTVRRGDLLAWIESRRVRPVQGADDAEMERRVRRLERERAKARGKR